MDGLEIDSNLSNRLAEEILQAGKQGLIPYNDAKEISNAILGKNEHLKVSLVIPTKVKAKVKTDLADLSYVRCSNCGKVYNIQIDPSLIKQRRCRICNSPLIPAPIWVIIGNNIPKSSRRITTEEKVKISLSIKEYVPSRRARQLSYPHVDRVIITDKSRPIASLKVIFNNGNEESIRPVQNKGAFRYWLSLLPSESITKPITITAFSYNKGNCSELNLTTNLPGIEKVLFCSNLKILQATIFYKAGHPRTPRATKISVIDRRSNPYTSVSTIEILARYITTNGLVVKTNSILLKKSLSKLNYKEDDMWIALHTISHAFLKSLPLVTGLESRDFGEAISVVSNEIAIYDNSQGGLGGVEGVVDLDNKILSPNYEWSVARSYECPLECTRSCKACLYTDSCYMLNYKLDRRILINLGWQV